MSKYQRLLEQDGSADGDDEQILDEWDDEGEANERRAMKMEKLGRQQAKRQKFKSKRGLDSSDERWCWMADVIDPEPITWLSKPLNWSKGEQRFNGFEHDGKSKH